MYPSSMPAMKVSPAPMVSTTSVEKPGTLTSSPPERRGAECCHVAALLLHQALCALRVVMQSELSLLTQVGEVLRPELAEVELLFDLLKAVSGQFRHPPVDEHPCDDVEDAVHPHRRPSPDSLQDRQQCERDEQVGAPQSRRLGARARSADGQRVDL